MAINPETTTTVKVSELASAGFNTTDLVPHEVGGYLKKGTLQDLATFIGGIISTEGSVAFKAVHITDGQTLPATTTEEFILVGPGTYPNVGGGSSITTTEALNALVSNGTYWYIGVEIPITASGTWGAIAGELSDQTDLQDALDLKADLVDGKVPSSQLPSYVDDVVEVANYAALPATGETGKIYITLNTNKVYRWSGSAYIEIAANNAVWGAITGTLSNQTDLNSALGLKVPYTGATGNVDLGSYKLTASDLVVNHTSGSGTAATISKGGNGEALTVTKSSGSGNVASFSGGVTSISELHLTTDLADDYIASASTWNAAYNDKINSAAVTGTTTKTLTLNQQDGGTITASWGDETGVVWGDITGSIFEQTDLQDALSSKVPSTRTITINGTSYNLTANRTWTIPAGTWGQINGLLENQTDLQSELDLKVPTSRTITINGTSYDLSANRSWTITAGVSGSGTTNYIPKFTGSTALGNSLIYDNGTNVGIGTTSPSTTLDVNGVIRGLMPSDPLTGAITAKFLSFSGNPYGLIFRGYATGAHSIQSQRESSDSTLFALSLNPLGGNVGIGTTSPSDKLTVSGGSIKNIISNGGSSHIQLTNTLGSTYFGNDGNGGYLYTDWNAPFLFYTNSNERMRITSGGDVGIGTSSPSTKLHVIGAITASAGFFNSDMRLKDLIDYDYNVSDIKPITYFWKDGRDDKKHVGYSAQEVQKVMPDAVNEGTDGMLSVNYVEVLVAQVELLNNRMAEMQKEIELLKSR